MVDSLCHALPVFSITLKTESLSTRTSKYWAPVERVRVFPDVVSFRTFFSHDISMAIMRLNYVTCNKNV